jgi:hypothetical protein
MSVCTFAFVNSPGDRHAEADEQSVRGTQSNPGPNIAAQTKRFNGHMEDLWNYAGSSGGWHGAPCGEAYAPSACPKVGRIVAR